LGRFKTKYTSNAVYTNSLKKNRSKFDNMPYIEVRASVNIPAGVEVFVSYGHDFWEEELRLLMAEEKEA
jgi:hypothetical protein